MAEYAAFVYNTTTQRPAKGSNVNISVTAAPPLISPFKRKSKSKSNAGTKSNSSSSSTRESQSSHSGAGPGTRIAFGVTATDPYAVYTDQLTQAKTNASQNSESRSSTSTAPQHNLSSSVWVGGGNVAIIDRHAPLSPEQKVEQKRNKERLARERAARKAGGQREDLDDNGRSNSISSYSVTGSSSSARASTDPPSSNSLLVDPFTRRHGRRYLRDTSLAYPLPCDLLEMHRQTMHTMLMVQVLGMPTCSSNFQHKPPKKVLEVGCGTGYWSSLCHQYFARRGHSVSFTGIDIAPLCPDMGKEHGMKWRFVQHDLRKTPLPFNDGEFDLVMVKDLSLAVTITTGMQQRLLDDYLRILSPGGSLEMWECDHTIRMLLPHAPPSALAEDSESEDEEQERANATGTYTLTAQTPLTAPQNQFLVDYNTWIVQALRKRALTPVPCPHIQPSLLQEPDLGEVESRRLAIPLSEVRWEREGIGGAITKDSASRRSDPHSTSSRSQDSERRTLSTAQAALRRTALVSLVQKIEALEPVLREVSGKGQDEWDRWLNNMMTDLMKQNGTSWGECLEVGAWCATKKKKKP